MSDRTLRGITVLLSLAVLTLASKASAFCGFYVAGADTKLYANATMVVLMRDGTRTVLSMQNNYQGPPEAFALVIPVPTVLTKEQVKILPNAVFQHVDALGAPRLVEYWETDPCAPLNEGPLRGPSAASAGTSAAAVPTVKVEAKFSVGEYDVVILSASDAAGLNSWLHDNNYNIPAGADGVLAPYVAAGTKFFVAKVDPSRVTFVDGQAALSPLRFHYDTPDFSLPVRLGLLNSQGTQDLIVNILAPGRYELANYPNVTIPTNLRVQDEVRRQFPSFYEALFAQLLEKNPGAVVTEYAWSSSSCDPCPTPPLDPSDLATFGADVTAMTGSTPGSANYTLTRLHYRYTQQSLGEDLVFKQAPPLLGGRGVPDQKGELDPSVQSTGTPGGGFNNFQGRYVILHPWENALTCQMPHRGGWGGPNGSTTPMAQASMNTALTGAAPQAANLAALLAQSLPALGVMATQPLDPLTPRAAAGSGAAGTGATGASAGARSVAGSSAAAGRTASPVQHTGCSCRIAHGATPASPPLSALCIAGVGLLIGRGVRRRRPRA